MSFNSYVSTYEEASYMLDNSESIFFSYTRDGGYTFTFRANTFLSDIDFSDFMQLAIDADIDIFQTEITNNFELSVLFEKIDSIYNIETLTELREG